MSFRARFVVGVAPGNCGRETGRIEVLARFPRGAMPQIPPLGLPTPFSDEPMHRPPSPHEEMMNQISPMPEWDARVPEAIAIDLVRAAGEHGMATAELFGFDEAALERIREILRNSRMVVMTRRDAGTVLSCQPWGMPRGEAQGQ